MTCLERTGYIFARCESVLLKHDACAYRWFPEGSAPKPGRPCWPHEVRVREVSCTRIMPCISSWPLKATFACAHRPRADGCVLRACSRRLTYYTQSMPTAPK